MQLNNPPSSNAVELEKLLVLLTRIADNTTAGNAIFERQELLIAATVALGTP